VRKRWISLLEVLLGAFLVIGHNVFHVLPNEVPILFVLFWISLRIRDGGWAVAGLRRPESWARTALAALLKPAYAVAMCYVALLFGFGHYYKGPAGVADSTYSGLVLGGAYLLTGRNLWTAILAHGISDTFAILVVFMGWAG
jgi:membrane protease YdiL (CAAX protease family)